jgi:hypothetical protein
MAMPGMKQDAEQDIDKAGELGFDIDLLRRELEALEGTVVMITAFWPLDSRGWAPVAKGYTDISRQFIS